MKRLILIFAFIFMLVYLNHGQNISQSSTPFTGNIYHTGGNIGIGITSPTSILHTIASGAKTVSYSGNKLSNTATSSTMSIIKAGLEITSTGQWSGKGAKNIGLYVSSVIQGTNNYDAIFNGGGNVGIGTISPLSKLGITGNTSIGASYGTVAAPTSGLIVEGNVGIGTSNPDTYKLLVAGGNSRFSTSANKNITIMNWDISGNGGITINANNDLNSAHLPLNFAASIFYFHSGNVGIGTVNFTKGTDNSYFKLAVNGNVRAKEVVVETNWSDFVFDENYKLKTLEEVEQFINNNKHLPDVPSANEVATNGISLGQSDAILLQKIEELTLYVIEQNKKIETLQKEVEVLKNK